MRSGASGTGLDRRSPAALEAHGHHLVNRGRREARCPVRWRAGRYRPAITSRTRAWSTASPCRTSSAPERGRAGSTGACERTLHWMRSAGHYAERITMARPTMSTLRHPQPARSAWRRREHSRWERRGRWLWPPPRRCCAAQRLSWLLRGAWGRPVTPTPTRDRAGRGPTRIPGTQPPTSGDLGGLLASEAKTAKGSQRYLGKVVI